MHNHERNQRQQHTGAERDAKPAVPAQAEAQRARNSQRKVDAKSDERTPVENQSRGQNFLHHCSNMLTHQLFHITNSRDIDGIQHRHDSLPSGVHRRFGLQPKGHQPRRCDQRQSRDH